MSWLFLQLEFREYTGDPGKMSITMIMTERAFSAFTVEQIVLFV